MNSDLLPEQEHSTCMKIMRLMNDFYSTLLQGNEYEKLPVKMLKYLASVRIISVTLLRAVAE